MPEHPGVRAPGPSLSKLLLDSFASTATGYECNTCHAHFEGAGLAPFADMRRHIAACKPPTDEAAQTLTARRTGIKRGGVPAATADEASRVPACFRAFHVCLIFARARPLGGSPLAELPIVCMNSCRCYVQVEEASEVAPPGVRTVLGAKIGAFPPIAIAPGMPSADAVVRVSGVCDWAVCEHAHV